MHTLVIGILVFALGLVIGVAGNALWSASDIKPIATGLITIGVVLMGIGGLELSGWRRARTPDERLALAREQSSRSVPHPHE